MGMAASQARLLSITSRMADNELRAQIVNNSKMRLATESSRVSEEYVSALNSATMMISNYDAAGTSQYQKLTYNALTAYSSHNNQYGLVNANGKLLVSETDATNFKDANGDIDNFLSQYGLIYSSTFFTPEVLGADTINLENISELTGATYQIGQYDVEELKAMYEGGVGPSTGIDHIGYNQALQSFQYANYTDYYNEFIAADDAYQMETQKAIEQSLFTTNYQTQINNVSSATYPADWYKLKDALTYVRNQYNALTSSGELNAATEYAKTLDSMLSNYSSSTNPPTLTSIETIDRDSSGNLVIGKRGDGSYAITLTKTSGSTYNVTGGAAYTETRSITDAAGNSTNADLEYSVGGISSSINLGSSTAQMYFTTYVKQDDDNDVTDGYEKQLSKIEYTLKNFDLTNNTVKMSHKVANDENGFEEARSYVLEVLQLYGQAANYVNRDKFTTGGTPANTAKNNYNAARERLLDFIFGRANRPTAPDGTIIEGNEAFLQDPGWIIAKFNGQTSQDFEVIKDIYVLDVLFDTYGEPAFGWIDENNPEENADAKVQWYTNLFERMQKGYQVLEDGLARSNEWIQFALESGLVTMEQVDNNKVWTGMTHANCSDITEVTDDAAVARAEAEYNKAMNNIENKDKRFDIELKNIDTEHNSLQTEYDSVKSVISENIKRSFKIYS